jgi:hypothetical protein
MKLRLLIRCCCLSACLFDQKVVWLFGSFPVNYCSETGVVMTPSVLQRAPAACSLSSIGCSTRPGQRKGTIDLSSGCLRTWLPWASATRGTSPASSRWGPPHRTPRPLHQSLIYSRRANPPTDDGGIGAEKTL